MVYQTEPLTSWEHLVKPAPFAYHRAHSVDEAVALLAEPGDEAKILAGGHHRACGHHRAHRHHRPG